MPRSVATIVVVVVSCISWLSFLSVGGGFGKSVFCS